MMEEMVYHLPSFLHITYIQNVVQLHISCFRLFAMVGFRNH